MDAAHIRWRSASGPNLFENGIALCKLHHWAFDKGILSIAEGIRIRAANVFVEQSESHLPIEVLHDKEFAVLPVRKKPSRVYCEWHFKNIYLGC